ncbi:putative phage tail protein [Exiguobacterium sp. S22-S28]|uniref:putative phage tail protein n=1 Tax=Exiguobacterium sp. S22-S28 TaxID=3342768 RepID=UPI00372D8484
MIPVTTLALDMQEDMFSMSAPYWRENYDMASVFLAASFALSREQDTIDRYLYSELMTATATDWGLSLKEDYYGLRDGVARTLDERRGRIRAAKRGGKVLTVEDLESVASAFAGGLVNITIDYDAFLYTIEFVDQLGIPTRIKDVQDALARSIPAYFGIVYKYRYNTYGDIKTLYATYQQLKDSGLTYEQILTAEGD